MPDLPVSWYPSALGGRGQLPRLRGARLAGRLRAGRCAAARLLAGRRAAGVFGPCAQGSSKTTVICPSWRRSASRASNFFPARDVNGPAGCAVLPVVSSSLTTADGSFSSAICFQITSPHPAAHEKLLRCSTTGCWQFGHAPTVLPDAAATVTFSALIWLTVLP